MTATVWVNLKNMLCERPEATECDPIDIKCPGHANLHRQKADDWLPAGRRGVGSDC